MRNNISLLLCCMCGCTMLHAQLSERPVHVLPTAYSTHHADVFSWTINTASLAHIPASGAGLSSGRTFLLATLNNYNAVFGLVTNSGNFGVKASYAGSADYNESQLGIAFAKKLGMKISAGLQFNYNTIHIGGGYGNAGAIGFETGVAYHITEHWHAALRISNPVGGRFSKSQEKLGAVYGFGIGYEASQKFIFSFEIEKKEDRPININAGCRYQFAPRVWAIAGVVAATASTSLGVGYAPGILKVTCIISYHPLLGYTPSLFLVLNLKQHRAIENK